MAKGSPVKCTKQKLTPLPPSWTPVKTAKAYYLWGVGGGEGRGEEEGREVASEYC